VGASAFNILIGGEAGQGLVTVGQLLAKSLVRSGFAVVVTQGYQSRIRGGHNSFSIRFGGSALAAPQEAVNLLVALDQETVRIHGGDIRQDGLVLLDEGLDPGGLTSLKVPLRELAEERFSNVVALGAAASLLGLDEEVVAKAMSKIFGGRKAGVAEGNRNALGKAYQWAAGFDLPVESPPAPPLVPRRLMMNGNEAIALGALSAGVRFCAFYPMTPSTTIPLALAGWAGEAGLVVEQAEDEISAVNMAIGASFAGAPSLVATSGGGFALMTEGVSLAGMTETPLVIVVAQRPGPATGLPTRTEQGDLEFVLHAGHGEFPRAILTPGSVEECFQLTRRAFASAERSQGPVFVLTDQFLADSYRDVKPFDIRSLEPVTAGSPVAGVKVPYERYADAADGVSPRLLPGLTEHLVVADSDEHTRDGHLTEDLDVRRRMVEKRLRKQEILLGEVVPPSLEGAENPGILLVSWGSVKGAAEEAVSALRAAAGSAAAMHFSQVWPLAPGQFLDIMRSAERVICVEGNATGQMARLIRRETGFEIREKILRYDGLPITPEYILRELKGGG
jgi:2-oxoglutarate ferredoxin oxidoreductase subunit alpha